jgi:hypothetical protein
MSLIKLMYSEMKIVLINITTLGISFSNIEMSLKDIATPCYYRVYTS